MAIHHFVLLVGLVLLSLLGRFSIDGLTSRSHFKYTWTCMCLGGVVVQGVNALIEYLVSRS